MRTLAAVLMALAIFAATPNIVIVADAGTCERNPDSCK